MALGNIVTTVLTKYKADTKDQRKELKKLQGAEKERHKKMLDQTDAQNKKLDGHIEMWGKVAIGIGAAVGAAKLLSDGFDTLQKNTALRAATVGVSLEGLRKATSGLVDDTRLLEFASKAMNGTFQLTQGEMEKTLRGTVALRQTMGHDLVPTLERVGKAITEGNVEPLKELGLIIKGKEGDSQEGVEAAVAALSAEADKLGSSFGLAGDDIKRAGTDLDNAADDMGDAIGEIAVALTPAIQKFAELVSWIARASTGMSDFIAGVETKSAVAQAQARVDLLEGALALEEGLSDTQRGGLKVGLDFMGLGGHQFASIDRNARDARNQLGAARGQLEQAKVAELIAQAEASIREANTAAQRGGTGTGSGSGRSGRGRSGKKKAATGIDPAMEQAMFDAIADSMQAPGVDLLGEQDVGPQLDAINASLELFKELKTADQQNLIAGIFGTPSEIDATAQALSALTVGVDGFTSAFGTGVGALIDGSQSFGQAFKAALGESLKAMAVDFSMQALRHGLFALGSLAFGNYGAAAKHGTAAASFGAGAVAAGAAARAFGVGQAPTAPQVRAGGGGTAGTAGVGTAQPGGTGPANGNTQVFILDDDFMSLSARERESRFRTRARSAGIDVEGTVVVNG